MGVSLPMFLRMTPTEAAEAMTEKNLKFMKCYLLQTLVLCKQLEKSDSITNNVETRGYKCLFRDKGSPRQPISVLATDEKKIKLGTHYINPQYTFFSTAS